METDEARHRENVARFRKLEARIVRLERRVTKNDAHIQELKIYLRILIALVLGSGILNYLAHGS